MKQYLLSILYLLAALVQPAIAQNSPQTKVAPAEPVMPYVVTIVQPTETGISGRLTATTDYPTVNTSIASGAFAYNDQEVKFKITGLPDGYFPADGFPKVYKTNDSKETISHTQGTFTMPKAPVTIEVKYSKVDDLDLSTLTKSATLTSKDSKWTYKDGSSEDIRFTGTVKGANTVSTLTVVGGGSTLTLANGASVSSIVPSTSAVTLKVAQGGTATVANLAPTNGGSITVSPADPNNGRLLLYLSSAISNNIKGLMQWTWNTAPTGTVTLYKPLTADNREEVVCTFSVPDSKTIFAINMPDNTPVKLKVGDKVQQGKPSSDATILFSGKTSEAVVSYTDVKDIEPAKAPNDPSKGITITSGDTYKEEDNTSETLFDGSVKGKVPSITVDKAVKDGAAIILDEVKKDTNTATPVDVAKDAVVTLAVKGENAIAVEVKAGATLTLTSYDDKAKLNSASTITNAGTFISETSLIKTVGGDAPLNVTGEPAGKEITATQSHTMTVAATPGTATGITLSYQWQSYDKDGKQWDNIGATRATSQLRAEPAPGPTSSSYATNAVGTYRCAITSKKNSTTTTLYTKAAEVTLKSDPDPAPDPTPDPTPNPDPTPTYHSVTLPAVTGATTDPVAGVHQVEAWSDFAFSLTLGKDYDQSKPVVKNSRGETITPRTTDGKYVVTSVREDITILITGIMSNIPTGMAGTEIGDRVWGAAGQLCIHTDRPKDVHVYNIGGQLQKVVDALNGDINLPLSAGNYIVVVGNKSYKVQVSR